MIKKLRSSGELYEIRQCRDLNTNELKAVKIYRKLELSAQAIQLIKREIELLKKLDHPNIMKIHQVIEDEDRIYLITDDIKGPNLFSYVIMFQTVRELEAATIAAQLASCIKYLHKHDIVIRRIKLETICFSEAETMDDVHRSSSKELKLTDLLLANTLE